MPCPKRLKERLLRHKEKQKELFKIYKLEWTEEQYIFLNIHRRPYVTENLSKPLRRFVKKHNLEHIAPYNLRHSFATFMFENGMSELVLMKLMGHKDFNTTKKYYIVVSKKKKLEEINKVYKNVYNKIYNDVYNTEKAV